VSARSQPALAGSGELAARLGRKYSARALISSRAAPEEGDGRPRDIRMLGGGAPAPAPV
jgi:hypothetical protein